MVKRGPIDVGVLFERLAIKSRRLGRERWACCPFHAEKLPSFQIKDDGSSMAGLWRCFGCGERGNAITLTAQLLDVSNGEAIELMESWAVFGPAPEVPARIALDVHERHTGRYVLPLGAIFEPLEEWPTPARGYLKKRGVTPAQVARWRIGHGVAGRLSGRIVVPVHDGAGVVRGYTARTYVDADKRYDEPSTKDGYEPGYVWGELWWPVMRRTVVVCEGAFNALAIERVLPTVVDAGEPPPVCALRGSNLHEGHVLRLGTFDRLIVASDPDKAGQKLWDALRGAFARWTQMSRVVLVGGDANELERKRPGTLVDALSDALGYS